MTLPPTPSSRSAMQGFPNDSLDGIKRNPFPKIKKYKHDGQAPGSTMNTGGINAVVDKDSGNKGSGATASTSKGARSRDKENSKNGMKVVVDEPQISESCDTAKPAESSKKPRARDETDTFHKRDIECDLCTKRALSRVQSRRKKITDEPCHSVIRKGKPISSCKTCFYHGFLCRTDGDGLKFGLDAAGLPVVSAVVPPTAKKARSQKEGDDKAMPPEEPVSEQSKDLEKEKERLARELFGEIDSDSDYDGELQYPTEETFEAPDDLGKEQSAAPNRQLKGTPVQQMHSAPSVASSSQIPSSLSSKRPHAQTLSPSRISAVSAAKPQANPHSGSASQSSTRSQRPAFKPNPPQLFIKTTKLGASTSTLRTPLLTTPASATLPKQVQQNRTHRLAQRGLEKRPRVPSAEGCEARREGVKVECKGKGKDELESSLQDIKMVCRQEETAASSARNFAEGPGHRSPNDQSDWAPTKCPLFLSPEPEEEPMLAMTSKRQRMDDEPMETRKKRMFINTNDEGPNEMKADDDSFSSLPHSRRASSGSHSRKASATSVGSSMTIECREMIHSKGDAVFTAEFVEDLIRSMNLAAMHKDKAHELQLAVMQKIMKASGTHLPTP